MEIVLPQKVINNTAILENIRLLSIVDRLPVTEVIFKVPALNSAPLVWVIEPLAVKKNVPPALELLSVTLLLSLIHTLPVVLAETVVALVRMFAVELPMLPLPEVSARVEVNNVPPN